MHIGYHEDVLYATKESEMKEKNIAEKSLEHDLDDLDRYMQKIQRVWEFGWTAYETRQSIEQIVKMMEQTIAEARTKIHI
jgi:hypothetical protein